MHFLDMYYKSPPENWMNDNHNTENLDNFYYLFTYCLPKK